MQCITLSVSTMKIFWSRASLLIMLLVGCDAFVPSSTSPRSAPPSRALYASVKNELTESEKAAAVEKATKAMTAFTNKYLIMSKTKLCADKSVPAVVIKGLAEHKMTLGAPLCPCRFYDDKEAEAKDGFWNCPCVPMRERHECHCMLFLTDDNAFVGQETTISYEEVVEGSKGMDTM